MKLLRFLLFPFAILYDAITSIRNWFFNTGILKSTSFNIPTIVVGNLSVGGTGKSPQIEYLIRLLKDNYKIAVLSRGYKRKTKGFQIVNSKHLAVDVGDEPLQFFTKFRTEITVAVDADRTNGINELLKSEKQPEVILLDDAYQHRKVNASTYILLTKYNDLFSNDFMLPTGNLRECRSGAKRAAIIIVTKCPDNLSEEEQNAIKEKINPTKNQQLFFTTISYDEELKGEKILVISELKNKEVLLVTGIANPNPLLKYLSEKSISFKHLKYPDHYNFTSKDILKIKNELEESESKIILTTEKDYMRLKGKLNNLNFIAIKSTFLNNSELFDNFILNQIKKRQF